MYDVDRKAEDLEFIGNFNSNRENSPTWVFQHHIDANDLGMGTFNARRFMDSRAISLGVGNLHHEPPVAPYNEPTTYQLLDISSNLLLFSVMPHRVFVVNPFHEAEHHIVANPRVRLPPHDNKWVAQTTSSCTRSLAAIYHPIFRFPSS